MPAGTGSAAWPRHELTLSSALSPRASQRARVAAEGRRGELVPATLLSGHPQRKKPRGHAAHPPCFSRQTGTCGMLARHLLPAEVHPVQCPGQGNIKAPSAAQETLQTSRRSRQHCPPPSSPVRIQPWGSVSERAAPWLQERGINGLSWLQQPRGINHSGCPRPRKVQVAHGSSSLLPSTGLPCSPHHTSGENKEAPMLRRQHLHLRHFRCPRGSQEISPALDKHEQPFRHPCHPRARR